MSDEDGSDTDDKAAKFSGSIDSREDRYDAFESWHSSIDLLNRQPLLCDPVLGDRREDGAPMRMPSGELIKDPDPSRGFLMGPAGTNLGQVSEAGRALEAAYRKMLESPFTAAGAVPFLLVGLGTNVGWAGTFDYQREGSFLEGYAQHRQFRPISDVNVGLFAQQAGLSRGETLWIAGIFALIFSGNRNPWEPYFLDPRTRSLIEQGYAIGARIP